MTDPRQLLQAARTILLVDWPNPGVPRALLAAGFKVFGYSPGRYSAAELIPDRPRDVDPGGVFAPRKDDETGDLVFRPLDGRPEAVDIVNVYRPAEEHAGVVADHVLPLGAKVLWLQPPVSPTEARDLAREHELILVEGYDIAEVARSLSHGR
jgi:hypothetical protein